MNKKILFIGFILYFMVLLIAGFLLFAKQSPIIWNETQISNTCLCAGPECTAEYCLGSRALGKPLLEEYVSGNYYITNPIAKKINIYFELIAFVVFILSTLYFILLYKKARA